MLHGPRDPRFAERGTPTIVRQPSFPQRPDGAIVVYGEDLCAESGVWRLG